MQKTARFPALQDWILRHSGPNKFIQSCGVRPDNALLIRALCELQTLALSEKPDSVASFITELRDSAQNRPKNYLNNDDVWIGTD